MNESDESTNGVLVAAALVFAALMVLMNISKPFTMTFTLDMLPQVLRRRIETRADGILITGYVIKKRGDGGTISRMEKETNE